MWITDNLKIFAEHKNLTTSTKKDKVRLWVGEEGEAVTESSWTTRKYGSVFTFRLGNKDLFHTQTNSSINCCAESNSTQRTEEGMCVYLLYYSVTFLSVWNYSRKDTSPTTPNQSDLVHSHQRGSWVHDRGKKQEKKSRRTSVLRLMEGVCSASFWRIASTAETGARSAVWGVLPAYRWFSENRSVPFMGRSFSWIMRRVETFSSKAISHVPLKEKKKDNYILFLNTQMAKIWLQVMLHWSLGSPFLTVTNCWSQLTKQNFCKTWFKMYHFSQPGVKPDY